MAAAARPANEYSAHLGELHEAISRLPDRYREPIVLCHLEGLSTAAAAQRLGCPQGTILSRLARGRERLRKKLCQQGQVESMGMLAATWASLDPNDGHAGRASEFHCSILCADLVGPRDPGRFGFAVRGRADPVHFEDLIHDPSHARRGLVGYGCRVTIVTIPIFRPGLKAGPQAAPAGKAPPGRQKNPETIEQGMLVARDMEDNLYKILKRDHEFSDPRWTFVIEVCDVQEKTLIGATFKHRAKEKINEYDAIIQAKRAVLRFDLDAKVVRVFLEDAEVQHFSRNADVVLIKDRILEIPIPAGNTFIAEQNLPGRVAAPKELRWLIMDTDQTLSVVYSPNGKTLATAGFDGAVHLWDAIKAKEVTTLKGDKSAIRAVTFSADGRSVASVNGTGDVKLWDVATGTLKKNLPGLSEPMREARGTLYAIAFAPDGELLATAGTAYFKAGVLGYLYELRILEVQSGQTRWSHMGRGEGARSLAFSPDGEVLASAGSKSRSVKLWNSQTGEPLRNLSPTRGEICSVAFAPDGRTLLGGGTEGPSGPGGQQPAGTITIWDVGQGRILKALEGQTTRVRALAIAPNGKTVAGGGWGRSASSGNSNESSAKSGYGTSLREALSGRSKENWVILVPWRFRPMVERWSTAT